MPLLLQRSWPTSTGLVRLEGGFRGPQWEADEANGVQEPGAAAGGGERRAGAADGARRGPAAAAGGAEGARGQPLPTLARDTHGCAAAAASRVHHGERYS